jgi:pimeloyl-ACP methyl ester carboxylesterase
MTKWTLLLASSLALAAMPVSAKLPIPAAIFIDPVRDLKHPARMEVLHVPSGDVALNGVAYIASGDGPHPTLVILHGLPGNEKNLDLAQAVRRAGWNAVTFNYRGSWGSPGHYSFAGNLQDLPAVLAYLRNPANAAKLGIDPARIALAGHSMGGWVAAMTAERDPKLMGTVLISAANMGGLRLGHKRGLEFMAENMESLATTAQAMADEVEQLQPRFDWGPGAAGLARRPLLVLSSDDGLAPGTDALASVVRGVKGSRVTSLHVATDHGWSDRRIRLETEVIRWISTLKPVLQ